MKREGGMEEAGGGLASRGPAVGKSCVINSSDNDNSSGLKSPTENINVGVAFGYPFLTFQSLIKRFADQPINRTTFCKTANETPSYSLTTTFSAM